MQSASNLLFWKQLNWGALRGFVCRPRSLWRSSFEWKQMQFGTRRWSYAALLLLTAALFSADVRAQQNGPADGQRLFSANCAACHGSDGRGGERAPSIATLRTVISLSDTDLQTIVGRGIPGVGMPPFGYLGDQRVHDLVAYLRVLQGRGPAMKVTGDPHAGRTLFYGKAECSKCHMVRGDGGFVAADLSSYGDSQSEDTVRRAIVQPDLDLEPTSKIVEVFTSDGKHLAGLLREEDNFTIAFLTADGRFHFFSKANLARILHTARSSMPRDYETRLTKKELDDIVSFLITTASTPHPSEPSMPKGAHDGN
jgi:cytochrome c oxidase cbb3-type subunit 3